MTLLSRKSRSAETLDVKINLDGARSEFPDYALVTLWSWYLWVSAVFLHLNSSDHGACMSCLPWRSPHEPLQRDWKSTKAGNAHHFPFCPHNEALAESSQMKLSDRRQELVDNLSKKIIQNEQNRLHDLRPARNTRTLNLRNKRKFRPVFKTKRFRNRSITFNVLKASTMLLEF